MNVVKQPRRMFVQMKKAVLREDLMAVTKDLTQSMVLGQMLYWTKTLDAVNEMIFEENKRLAEENLEQYDYNYGWIWKSAKEMREDLMMAFSEDAIQKAFSVLSASGLLMKRNNPKVRYDRKLQYRIDLVFLRRKLKDCGWEMTDFILANNDSEMKTIPPITECIPPIAEWKPPIAESIPPIAETITETTNKITTQTTPPTPLKGAVSVSSVSVVENKSISEFETFYSNYPRKVAKPNARKAWDKNKCKLEEVLPALEKHKKTWNDPQFIPHPATWLNQRRWEDETIVKQESSAPKGGRMTPAEAVKNNGWTDEFWTWLHTTAERPDIQRDYLTTVEDRWLVEFIAFKKTNGYF